MITAWGKARSRVGAPLAELDEDCELHLLREPELLLDDVMPDLDTDRDDGRGLGEQLRGVCELAPPSTGPTPSRAVPVLARREYHVAGELECLEPPDPPLPPCSSTARAVATDIDVLVTSSEDDGATDGPAVNWLTTWDLRRRDPTFQRGGPEWRRLVRVGKQRASRN